MWLNRKTYDDLWKQLHETTIANQILERHATALETTMDWLRVRVTQLEMERAQLLWNYTGVRVPTPEIKRTEQGVSQSSQPTPFKDVGDAEAAKLGISWNEDGTLNYAS